MNYFISTLFKILNNPDIHDTNYQIAYTLIENCYDIENMTIQELAEKCYVSVSTLNRFLKNYGYNKFTIFKSVFSSHLKIRKTQMLYRMKNKNIDLIIKVLQSCINEEQINNIMDNSLIIKCCENIKRRNRIILIGSDEMMAQCLRFQGDFCTMKKVVIHDSIYKTNFFFPKKDDIVILLSMSGRIIELNDEMLQSIQKNDPFIITVGYEDYVRKNNIFLKIPKNLDETIENMIFDYYLQEITYTYMRNYYDS